MASQYEAMSYANVVSATETERRTIRWSRVAPMMLLVPIVLAFGTPVLAFALLTAILAAPAIAAFIGLAVLQRERG